MRERSDASDADADADAGTDPDVQVAQVRRFNRVVTERVGVLQERFHGTDRPYGQARLLWEIGGAGQAEAEGPLDVRKLRDLLGLDSGYVSRLLRALEADGLVVVEPLERDRRVRTARLTERGREEWALLDRRSDEAAGSLLAPLNTAQRARLVAAMAEVDRLLTAGTVTLDDVPPDHPDAELCLRGYFAEVQERFDTGFDPARSLLPDAGELAPPRGQFVVARLHGEPVGCAGLKLPPGGAAEVKRMWVAPKARGLGLARRFLTELEARAVRHGAELLRLDTNKALHEAIGLYRKFGFEEVEAFNDEPYAHLWFEKRLRPTG
ncbi:MULTISPECIES: bifunctional helix-turn-helix transcriptional regulator/GNAT family N-acetyltransferase [unclassified Streptomyces]|uniref:bifunctional helix-turn-helix transcriptional regulator/GNAT family N-acetyltransferase n=1 Tax=unclassified Streptomyces TaxID=2593676 RepID=UPI00278C43F3|nr:MULTISPECIES: bifunctional helix-turn-helix transcriptional regulator/GNAT family N-acetyltransferase [unclassified Streptomyces]